MNQRGYRRTILLFGALSWTLGVGAQFPPPELQRPPEPPSAPPAADLQPHDRLADQMRAGRAPLWRRMWLERDGRTSDPLGLRAGLWEELRHVPTLERHLREFIAIQKERVKLEREREQIARGTERPAAEQLARFHEVLKREDQLNTRSVALLTQIKADRRTIEQEVKLRLDQLEEHPAPAERQPPKGEAGPATQATKRWRRFYGALLGQLDRLEEAGNAGEWFGALTRTLWQQERTSQEAVEGALRQLDRLQREQDELRRRLENVQNQLDDLSELLSTLRTKSRGPGDNLHEGVSQERPRVPAQPRNMWPAPHGPSETKSH